MCTVLILALGPPLRGGSLRPSLKLASLRGHYAGRSIPLAVVPADRVTLYLPELDSTLKLPWLNAQACPGRNSLRPHRAKAGADDQD